MNYCISCMLEIDQDATNCPFCGKKQNVEIPPHHLMPGTILKGRFLVGTALGEGGFGITYIGRDLQLDMRVAIKEFYPNGYVNRNNTVAPVVSIATYGEHRDFFEAGRERFLRLADGARAQSRAYSRGLRVSASHRGRMGIRLPCGKENFASQREGHPHPG